MKNANRSLKISLSVCHLDSAEMAMLVANSFFLFFNIRTKSLLKNLFSDCAVFV